LDVVGYIRIYRINSCFFDVVVLHAKDCLTKYSLLLK